MRNLTLASKYGDKADCPACSGEVVVDLVAPGRFTKGTCGQCGGLIGHYASINVAYEHVRPTLVSGSDTRTMYFDQTFENPDGRRHGWCEVSTRYVVQYG